ncbi:MAG: ABC transporter permease [Planctomycetota bacterium]
MSPSFVLRALWREVRASRRRSAFFVGCLAVGVAAVTGVASLTASVAEGFRVRSRELLGADLVVSARRELPADLAALFDDVAHERTDLRELPSMASATLSDGTRRTRLVDLRVVAGRYPLYGSLTVEPPGDLRTILDAGDVLVSPELRAEFGLHPGASLTVGGTSFRVAGVVTGDTDGVDFSLLLGPRVYLGADALARAEILGRGSNVRYRALFALPTVTDPQSLARLAARVGELPDASYYQVEVHTEGQPSVQQALDRLGRFLGLVALLSLLLGGIGTAQVVRTWIAIQVPAIAIQRCLGFRPRDVLALHLGQVVILSLAGSALGVGIGGAFPLLLPWFAGDLVPAESAVLIQPWAWLRGFGLGLGTALVFVLPPLTAVWRVPPLRVLRADVDVLPARWWLRLSLSVFLFLGVSLTAYTQSGSWSIALGFAGALFAITGALFFGARLLLWVVARAPRRRLHPYVAHGIGSLGRPGAGTIGTLVALGLGVAVVFTVQIVRMRLIDELSASLPAGAPSAYIWDVQPPQWEGVSQLLQAEGATTIQAVPVVTCRLRSIDGRPVAERVAELDRRGRANWLFTREQRITWLPELPPDNRVVAGELWSDPARPELSVEEGFAKELGVSVGSTLVFDVQGVPLEFVVTSLRTVAWRSFGINFFLLAEPGVLAEAPHFLLAGVRMTSEQEQAVQNRLVVEYPNTTQIRVRPILDRVSGVLDRAILAIAVLGSFTVVTGLVILTGAISATFLRRRREAALLKTLGATRRGVMVLFTVEYALLGLVAGTIGTAAAFLLAGLFFDRVLDLVPRLPWGLGVPIVAGTALLVAGAGLAASARAIRAAPLETLRAAE